MTDILFFAAGLGTRMAPLTADRPKPLIPVAGKPLFDHAFDLTTGPEIGRRFANVHYLPDQMRAHLAARSVSVSDETELLRDTGGGLTHALPQMQGDPVMTLNTDAVWHGENPIPRMMATWHDGMDCLLMLVPRDRAVGHTGTGDFVVSPDGRLSRGPGAIYTGLQLIRRTVLLPYTDPVFSLNTVWSDLISKGTLYGMTYSGRWCDVGRPDSIPLAEALLQDTADV